MTPLTILSLFWLTVPEATKLYNPFTHKHIFHDLNLNWTATNIAESIYSTSSSINQSTNASAIESPMQSPMHSSPRRHQKIDKHQQQIRHHNNAREEKRLLMNAMREAHKCKLQNTGKLIIYYANYECIAKFEEDLIKKAQNLLIIPGFSYMMVHNNFSCQYVPPLNHSIIKTTYGPLEFGFFVTSTFFTLFRQGPLSYAVGILEWLMDFIHFYQLSTQTKRIFTFCLSAIKPIIKSEKQSQFYRFLIDAFFRNNEPEISATLLTSQEVTRVLLQLVLKCIHNTLDVLFDEAVQTVNNNVELSGNDWSHVFQQLKTNFKTALEKTIESMTATLVERTRKITNKDYEDLVKIKKYQDMVLLYLMELKSADIIYKWLDRKEKKRMDIHVLFLHSAIQDLPVLELIWRDEKFRKNESCIVENYHISQSRKKKLIITRKHDNNAVKAYKKHINK